MVFGAEKFIALQISSPSLHLVNNSLVSGFIGLDARFKSWSSAKFLKIIRLFIKILNLRSELEVYCYSFRFQQITRANQ